MRKIKKLQLLPFSTTLAFLIAIASFFPSAVFAADCGETYAGDVSQCTCSYSENANAGRGNKCCGIFYDGECLTQAEYRDAIGFTEVGCGDIYSGTEDQCTCEYSLNQTISSGGMGVPEKKCCGLEYEHQCYTQDEYDAATAGVIAADDGEVECGDLFLIDSEATCNCSNQVYFKTVGDNEQYCCGWISQGSCLDHYMFEMCRQIADSDMRSKCEACQSEGTGVWTAIGCIPTDRTSIVQVFIKLGVVSGGGISLLIILAGSFMLSVSQGDPKKTSEAKEMITSAIIGLIFIIFSVSLLQLIGVQILHIPGFGD